MLALIGDIVASRALPDRVAAQQRLAAVLAETATLVTGVQPLEVTVGDEFQGAYSSVGDASRVALLVRLAVLPAFDVRFGLGFGETTILDPHRSPMVQDGPAWWAAREAIEGLGEVRRSAGRTAYVGPEGGLVNAYLLCRDALVDRLNERGWRMLRLSLCGETQQRIAELEGVSKSAVSQAFARGISAVRDAQNLLEEAA